MYKTIQENGRQAFRIRMYNSIIMGEKAVNSSESGPVKSRSWSRGLHGTNIYAEMSQNEGVIYLKRRSEMR